jgi:predicted nuclease of predicted toxin-antitoxin system
VTILRARGHDVLTAADLALSRASDVQLLQAAHADRRVLLTRDRHFGSLVFASSLAGGVIYLRILPSTQNAVHDELITVLDRYDENELLNALVVVEPGRHRIRRKTP